MSRDTRAQSWIHQFARRKPKPPDYAEKTLAAYRLGMKARGSIAGVQVLTSDDSCPHCRALAGHVYTPDNAPRLPYAGCTHPEGCRCAYAPVMQTHERLTELIHGAVSNSSAPPADHADH
jgi:hypothetical protein